MQKLEYEETNLKEAIIKQAVDDYRRALDGKSCDKIPARMIKSDVERFFRSHYFQMLTKINGEYLIEQLQKEHEEKVKEREKNAR